MNDWRLTLTLLPEEFAICRLHPDAPQPEWAAASSFVTFSRTREELSVTCAACVVPDGVEARRGWRCLKVEGPFELETTVGVLAALAAPLARVGVSLYVVSTFDTDYLFVQGAQLHDAVAALEGAGHRLRE